VTRGPLQTSSLAICPERPPELSEYRFFSGKFTRREGVTEISGVWAYTPVNASYQGRGYATEMAQALVAWALRQPTVRRVTAECLEDNPASIRVLEKSGFVQSGRRKDEEGPLLLWERKP